MKRFNLMLSDEHRAKLEAYRKLHSLRSEADAIRHTIDWAAKTFEQMAAAHPENIEFHLCIFNSFGLVPLGSFPTEEAAIAGSRDHPWCINGGCFVRPVTRNVLRPAREIAIAIGRDLDAIGDTNRVLRRDAEPDAEYRQRILREGNASRGILKTRQSG